MAGEHAAIEIVAPAGTVADIDRHGLAREVLRHVLRERRRSRHQRSHGDARHLFRDSHDDLREDDRSFNVRR